MSGRPAVLSALGFHSGVVGPEESAAVEPDEFADRGCKPPLHSASALSQGTLDPSVDRGGASSLEGDLEVCSEPAEDEVS